MSAEPTVSLVDPGDDAALDELLAFAARTGLPRATTAAAYRDLVRTCDDWSGFVARDGAGGELRAVALATVDPAIGRDQVQLNAFLEPGAQSAFDAVLNAVAAWARMHGAGSATAHVSDPTEDDLVAWQAAGFAQVGERAKVVLDLGDADRDRTVPDVPGVSITSLAERPDLLEAAGALWRTGLGDVPSELRFRPDEVPGLDEELQAVGDRAHVLLAVDDDTGDLAGFALLIRTRDRMVAGHRMTATARAWRGRGIGLALKVAAIRWAAANGITRLQASNDSANAPMRAINDRLGYELEYRLVLLRRAFPAE